MYKIEKVSPDVVRPPCHKVLRPNLSFEASCLPFNNDFGAIHFTLKKDDTILSTASFYYESLDAMPNKSAYQLRGMSNRARKTAFGFYGKMGFTILGKVFDIPKLDPHKTGFIEL